MGDPRQILEQKLREEGVLPPEPVPVLEPAPITDTVQSGNVTVTQTVVSLGEGEIPDDWEDVVDDRYGATGGLS